MFVQEMAEFIVECVDGDANDDQEGTSELEIDGISL